MELENTITKLYHYEVKIFQQETQFSKSKFINEEVEIATQNMQYLIVNDWYLTKLKKEKSSYDTCINLSSIRFRTNDSIASFNGLFYTLYSTKPKTPASIRKELDSYIKKKIGYLTSIDLSIIK